MNRGGLGRPPSMKNEDMNEEENATRVAPLDVGSDGRDLPRKSQLGDVIDCLKAYGETEATTALMGKDREQYQFWQGWLAALQRVPAAGAPMRCGQCDQPVLDNGDIICIECATAVTEPLTDAQTRDAEHTRAILRATVKGFEAGQKHAQRAGASPGPHPLDVVDTKDEDRR